jgi:hypothetical protein
MMGFMRGGTSWHHRGGSATAVMPAYLTRLGA